MTVKRLLLVLFLQTNRLLLIFISGSLLLLGFLEAGTPMAHGQALSLVWSDEFNSVTSSNVDTTKWEFESGNNGGWGNNELEFYTGRTNNAFVAGGLLHIHAQVENTNGFRFTSARMKTQDQYWFTYGRVEWRSRFPSGVGMWPALWMMGTNIANLGWPACGEIDVVESPGNPSFEQGSLHNGGTISDVTTVFTNFVGGDVTAFHVYDLDWTSTSIVWSVDGVAYETRTQWTSSTSKPFPFPYNQPFFLLMNFATGGNYVGNPSTNAIAASLPAEIQVDYVRVYQAGLPTVPPSTVTGLTATQSGASVLLNWNTANNAASYFVKRSLVSGGPYTTNANPSATTYTDTTATNCTTYYYVVSGVNNIGEGTNSNEAAVTIVGQGTNYYFAVNSGGGTAGNFVADTDVTGGNTSTTTSNITTVGVTNPAPVAVYQSERWGASTYTFGGLASGFAYKVRLHFAEIFFSTTNSRKFNVTINGSQVLTNFDVLAAAGGMDKAIVKEYTATPVASSIVVAFSNGSADSAKISGIEIISILPSAPSGLTATGGVGQVALNWAPVSGNTGYNVKRSLSNGGPYTNVTSGILATNYTDTGLLSGTIYYYVVSTLSVGCNESTNSAQAIATTAGAQTFAQWQTQYFGSTTNPLAAANVDADGTGQNNQFKYVAGLDPTNPSSIFILTIASVTNQPTQMNLLFKPMAGGRTYTPQFMTDMVSGVWTQLVGYAGPVTNGNQGTITDMNAVPSNEFYRIDISCTNCP
jgi:beta-glucanase (GH16 family)